MEAASEIQWSGQGTPRREMLSNWKQYSRESVRWSGCWSTECKNTGWVELDLFHLQKRRLLGHLLYFFHFILYILLLKRHYSENRVSFLDLHGKKRQETTVTSFNKINSIGHTEKNISKDKFRTGTGCPRGLCHLHHGNIQNTTQEGPEQLQLPLKEALHWSGRGTRSPSVVFSNLNYAMNYEEIHFPTYPQSNYNAKILQSFLCSKDQLNKEIHSIPSHSFPSLY